MATPKPHITTRHLGDLSTVSRLTRHHLIILHTMVGTLKGTDAYFRQNGFGGTESHYGIGGKWGLDGQLGLDGAIWEWVPPTHQADANYEANDHAISIETGDNGGPTVADIPAWTPKQCESIARLIAWLSEQYDIPLALVHDSKPGRRGIAYHRQGCTHSQGTGVAGFRVAGGEVWSTATGKECPTNRRIAQIPGIIERAKQIRAEAAQPPAPTQEDGDMAGGFIGNTSDGRQWLFAGNTKRLIPNPDVAQDLVEFGFRNVGTVTTAVANFFATATALELAAQQDRDRLVAGLDGLTRRLEALAVESRDDATSAELDTLKADVAALRAALDEHDAEGENPDPISPAG